MSVLLPNPPKVFRRTSMIKTGSSYALDQQHSSSIPSLPKHFNVPFAIQHGYFRCVRYLLQLRYDPNERDGQLRTPLILCAYVENDRWSLSLAQNLLEKGAKIALEDHARRNAMHHACALQRLHLVKLFLACLDFNIDAKDCEGNTCLHYVAITGNCEIAELIMRSAEKIGIRLDQVTNREGCSAAVLALKYGHLECANQISHRDCDEFFVVPRPLSIYEAVPNSPDLVKTPSNVSLAKNKNPDRVTNGGSAKRLGNRPSNLSFGLLKIIFNESDTGYSTRLAGLCREDKENRRQQKRKLSEKKSEALEESLMTLMMMGNVDRTTSTTIDEIQCSSTEAVVNASQSLHLNRERKLNGYRAHMDLSPLAELTHRMPLTIDQNDPLQKSSSTFIQATQSKVLLSADEWNKVQLSIDQKTNLNNEVKSKHSNATFNPTEATPSRQNGKKGPSPPKSGTVNRPISPRSSSSKSKAQLSAKKKSAATDRSQIPTNNGRTFVSDASTSVQSTLVGSSSSTLARFRSTSRRTDGSLTIHEAKGPTSRYNQPEALFGLRPAELFGSDDHQPKILGPRSKRPSTHLWQQDLDHVIGLYNIHQSPNYRPSAIPPQSSATTLVSSNEIHAEPGHGARHRRGSISKSSVISPHKSNVHGKTPVVPPLHIPRRNSISRPLTKLPYAS